MLILSSNFLTYPEFKMANFSIDVPQIISTLTAQLNFKTQFSAFTTNAERVQLCLAQKEVQLWADLFVSKFVSNRSALKCQDSAAEYREKGNDHFRGENFQNAIQLYSMAICLAPQSVDDTGSGLGSELALAFGNRSAAYFRLGQHDNALKDIDDALAHDYAQFKSVTKLHLRKCDCLIQLGRVSEAQKFLHFMQKPTGDENDTKRWIELFALINLARKKLDADNKDESTKACDVSLIEKLTNKGLFKSNEKMSSFSTKVAVHYDSEKGRHLVAQEDIQFGDILAVSKPYATLLGWKDDTKDDTLKCCHHCYRDIFQEDLVSIRPHPCPRCSSVVYCSEECRTESENSYHQFECGQHDMLVQVPRFSRMSLRMLYRAGIDQIRSAVSAAENPSHFSEQPDGHYSHVYQLVHHSDGPLESLDISYSEMLECSLFACLLLQLAKNAHFPINPEGEGEKLIGGILLRHLLQARFNVFYYSPFDKKVSSLPVQLDLYPMYASTLNHSCMANARLESPKDQYVCFLQAARPISAGTEITISYLNDENIVSRFYETRMPQIHSQLRKRHCFHCNCIQCKYQTRNMPFGVVCYYPLRCQDCWQLIERSEKSSISKVFRCKCSLEMTNAEVKQRYIRIDELQKNFAKLHHEFRTPMETIVDDSFWTQITSIIDEIEILLYYDLPIVFSIILISCSYLNLEFSGLWWRCHETILSIIQYHFGVESVEFLQAFDMIQHRYVEQFVKLHPSLIDDLKEPSKQLYFTRVELLKQLKSKYFLDY